MTTNAMSCELFNDHLMAFLEHEADDATRATLERHALSCEECGALLADLRKLRIDASNLQELAPSRNLWPGIASRIEAPVVPLRSGLPAEGEGGGGTRRFEVHRFARAALIAASLVAAAGIGYLTAYSNPEAGQVTEGSTPGTGLPAESARVALATETGEGIARTPAPSSPEALPAAPGGREVGSGVAGNTPSAVAGAVPPVSPGRPLAAQLAVATLAADYDREIARLRVLIDQRRNQLDPVTVAVIEKNLQVIDTAIVECKTAIARDPASRFLIESLNQSLQTKVELMRIAALLPSRT